MFACFIVAAETKVLPDRRPSAEPSGVMAKDEIYAFQAAYFSDELVCALDVRVTGAPLTVRAVECVPCTVPFNGPGDSYYLSAKPFLCPDVLRPIDKRKPVARQGQWSAVWFTAQGLAPGVYPIRIEFYAADELLGTCEYTLEVLACEPGTGGLLYTNWFHYDGLAAYYRVPVFSDEYNRIMYRFIADAAAHGMNMLLTPVFTPPLDTRVGQERLTVQLVDVTKHNGQYSFSFARLIAFMQKARSLGIRYFEISHLFTQWGAAAAPKIMATDEGVYKRLFGWDTPAVGGEYERFLRTFLPALRDALNRAGLYADCYFHVSDEPNETNIEAYTAARAIFKACLPDATLMDALSHYEFYERGLVDMAVAATDAIQTFLDHDVPGLWAYYCCGQSAGWLSNRLMAMPGERTRVLGFQLFLNDIRGFLHWGYNFYNSVLSDEAVDPFGVTDGGGGFPSGDSFIVYPGADGPLDSVRHELFYGAIQDYNLMCAVAARHGRDTARKLLTEHGFQPNFHEYPRDPAALKAVRRAALALLN